MACTVCADTAHQGRRHRHFLSFPDADALRAHLEAESVNEHLIVATIEWYHAIVQDYRGCADPATGKLMSVGDAWVLAHQGKRVVPYG